MSSKKTNVMAFRRNNPVRSKSVLDDKILEEISDFYYLGCGISYDCDKDIDNQISAYQVICGIIRGRSKKLKKHN
jgi:hypothetical protein